MGGAPPLYRRPTPAAQTYTFHGFRVLKRKTPVGPGFFFLADSKSFNNSLASVRREPLT